MLYCVESHKDLNKTAAALNDILSKHNLGQVVVHDLRREMAENGVSSDKECIVYQFSRCEDLKLPLTISLFTESDHVKLATLRPSFLPGWNAPVDMSTEIEIEKELVEVIEEAAK